MTNDEDAPFRPWSFVLRHSRFTFQIGSLYVPAGRLVSSHRAGGCAFGGAARDHRHAGELARPVRRLWPGRGSDCIDSSPPATDTTRLVGRRALRQAPAQDAVGNALASGAQNPSYRAVT